MRKRYVLIKDTPELKKGAILEEMCDDGDQDYQCVTMPQSRKFPGEAGCIYDRMVVEKQPQYFREVVPANIVKEYYQRLKKLHPKIIY